MPTNSNKAYAGELVGRGDLTRALFELLQVPECERDDDWHKAERQVRGILNDMLTRITKDLTIPVYPVAKAK